MALSKFAAALTLLLITASSSCNSTASRLATTERHATPRISNDARRDFAGEWDTTYGPLSLSRFADRLAGNYGDATPRAWIEGVEQGNRFTFTYRESSARGEGWFELEGDGASFHGQWREHGDDEWADWNGTRANAVPREHDFSGVWRTSYGALRLEQQGASVHGTYSQPAGSTLDGTVEGNVLRADYAEPDGTRGRALFELAEDGARFRCVWSVDANAQLDLADADARTWTGERAVAVPGRKWLVVLEAPWEASLGEHEYSYGAMLRAFFERVPSIEVRHRWFHDRADFERVCAELADLVEPVVLYVSTHGSEEGIQAGRDLIDGQVIGEALRDVKNLELLHLGGCALLGGELGPRIRAAAGRAFPISGFTVSVDWVSSALVDFTYLDLVLEQDRAPAEAAKAVRAMLSFANAEGNDDDPLPATDLTLLEVDG